MVILSGCANNTALLTEKAAARQGTVAAGVDIDPQPDECGKDWRLLTRGQLVGHDALSAVKRYEAYIINTINPQKKRCFELNEAVRSGLRGGGSK